MNDATTQPIRVLDGHNDALNYYAQGTGRRWQEFLDPTSDGAITLPAALQSSYGGGFFAANCEIGTEATGGHLEWIERPEALTTAVGMLLDLVRIAAVSDNRLEVVTTSERAAECLENGTITAIAHLEGCDAIGENLDALETLYALGLRSLGPVWSRSNVFGHGVPPRSMYGHGPDTGPGLSAAGFELIRASNRLGVIIDLSHMNEAGFWDVTRTTTHPLVATHSNAHSITPVPRNLTDQQLHAIRDTGGVVGVSFYRGMLHGTPNAAAPGASALVEHIEYIVELIGVEHVAIGSDLGTASCPDDLSDTASMSNVVSLLRDRGWAKPDIEALANKNWLRVMLATWGS